MNTVPDLLATVSASRKLNENAVRETSISTWDAYADEEWQVRARRIADIAVGVVVVFTLLLTLAVMSAWHAAGMAV